MKKWILVLLAIVMALSVLAGASYEGEDSEGEAKPAASEYAKIDAAVKEISVKI